MVHIWCPPRQKFSNGKHTCINKKTHNLRNYKYIKILHLGGLEHGTKANFNEHFPSFKPNTQVFQDHSSILYMY